jgi:hypothetical protein
MRTEHTGFGFLYSASIAVNKSDRRRWEQPSPAWRVCNQGNEDAEYRRDKEIQKPRKDIHLEHAVSLFKTATYSLDKSILRKTHQFAEAPSMNVT